MLKQLLTGALLSSILLAGSAATALQAQALPLNTIAQAASEPQATELQQFARAWVNIQLINQQAQQAITQAVQASDFAPERLQSIAESLQNETAPSPALTETEQQNLSTLDTQISQIQQQAVQFRQQAVQEEGLDLDRFQAIGSAIQESPQLQEEINGMIRSLVEALEQAS